MFAAMAGEAGCRSYEIIAMAAALPGRGDYPGRNDHGGRTDPAAPDHLPGVERLAENVWLDESAAFAAAFRPTTLLPEDALDSQPFVDHELIFVCRARLDDRAGLLQQLQIDSARGATLSDAHIVRHCYKKWREETPRHVYGDFAFVAWERWSRRTVAATDHLGNFRLFYCRAAGRILFATQLAALLACPAVHAGLDIKSLGLTAVGKLGRGWTMFEGVKVLSGGELLIHHDEMLRVERWWRPDISPREVHARARDYVDEARALFDSAVAARLRARGGVIATLSGGLDSTLVAVTAARQLAATGKVLEAFTAIRQPGLPVNDKVQWENDDAAWAAAAADFQPNIRQRLVSPEGLTPLDILPLVHAFSNTPVHNPASLVWAWQMSARAAHNRAHVILCGDHGNQSISYAGDLCDTNFIRLRRIAGAAQHTWDRVRCIGTNPHKNGAAARHDSQDVLQLRRLRPGCEILLPEFCTEHHEELLEAPPGASEREMFTRAMTSPQPVNRVDFMARFGVEWLDPTGDRKLLERLLTFPLHVFRVGNRPRGLARELGRGLIPDNVRLRRTRNAHFPDETAWFSLRAPDYQTALQSIRDSSTCGFFLDLSSLEPLLQTLCAGRGSAAEALIVHRALDVGLFAVEFESGHSLQLDTDLQMSPSVPTLNVLAGPAEVAAHAHA